MTRRISFDRPNLPSASGAILLALLIAGLLVPRRAAAQGFLPGTSPAVSSSGPIARHEPIFGRGPRTLWQGGYGIGVGIEREAALREQHWALDYHLSYGMTERWMGLVELHQEPLAEGGAFNSFGNLRLRSKYRFFMNNVPGGIYHAAAVGGVSLPTGTAEHSPDAVDATGGLSAAYEGRRWLLFGTARYRLNTQGATGVNRGDVWLYDLALGIRPVLTGYYQPDVVLMGELNGEIFQSSSPAGPVLAEEDHHGQVGPGGHRLLAGFGAWITYRNWAVKPGLQVPLYNGLEGGTELDYHALLEVEVHF